MDLLAQYSDASGEAGAGDGDTDDDVATTAAMLRAKHAVPDLAPRVNDAGLAVAGEGADARLVSLASTRDMHDPARKKIYYNVKYDALHEPIAGPANPFNPAGASRQTRNHATGHVEWAHVNKHAFDEQFQTFNALGYAVAPDGSAYVGDAAAIAAHAGETVFTSTAAKRRKVRDEVLAAAVAADPGASIGGPGANAPPLARDRSAWAPARDATKPLTVDELTEEAKEYVRWHAARREANLRRKGRLKDEEGGAGGGEDEDGAGVGGGGAGPAGEKSFFHGKEERNYAGESWLAPPKDRKKENDHCYAPKRLIHTWSGHTKGVQAIRFFPRHGHLILSAGMDSKIKIWDVHNTGKCMRTYLGHDKAVKDINFTSDGARFVSSSHDKKIKLWDTETGKVISTFTSGKMAYAAVLHPEKQNILMAAQSDKKIVQYDMNTGDVVQEYDQHLGAVNTVTFVDEGRRFVTTSDDKSMRVWEFGIPVVMKYIADPSMHSMPAVTLSPNQQWLACQSLDNQIMIYSAKDRFRLNTKKRFTGHANGGYACQPNFSPDGRFLMSGDADGKCIFWDWKSRRIFKTLKAHDKVTIGCEWHPLETSKVATCSWDGTIKYWD